MKTATHLELDGVSFHYGSTAVCQDLNVMAQGGEMLALLGPSGCGKTTVLKLIAGLLDPVKGEVRFDRKAVTGIPAEKRDVALVFQKPLLFPHLTVGDNVAFGLKMRGVDRLKARARAAEALEMVRLQGFAQRRPGELSGGQEQRVALARALVTDPRVLLLDEPFSALEAELRAEMGALVRELQKRLRVTTVFVTHDQQEASTLADRIALMRQGRIEQIGIPQDFYSSPRSAYAARFFGWQVFAGDWMGLRLERIQFSAFRPETVVVTAGRTGPGIAAVVERSVALGKRNRLTLRTTRGEVLDAELWNSESTICTGDPVMVHVPPEALRFFGEG